MNLLWTATHRFRMAEAEMAVTKAAVDAGEDDAPERLTAVEDELELSEVLKNSTVEFFLYRKCK